MQGKKQGEPRLFYTVNTESIIPQDHAVRRIAEILDLTFLYEETKPYYSHEGKPSIDPVVIFKLHVLAYFFNIPSERKLMQEVRVNLAYRWYLGYDIDEAIPDHSILSKARARFPEEVFTCVFVRIIRLCKERGLISGETHFIDSSLIRADASKESFSVSLPDPHEFMNSFSLTHEKQDNGKRSYTFDGIVDPEHMGRRRDRERKSQKIQSSTDPHAQLITRPGKGTFPAYKAHLCVDRRQRVILSVNGTAATDDDMSAIDPLLSRASMVAGRLPNTVVADSHYGGIEALKYYQDRGIATCIHPRIADNRKGMLRNTDFRISPDEHDCYCPANKCAIKKVNNKFRIQFRFSSHDCQACPLRLKCTDSPHGRMITYYRGGYFSRASDLTNSARGRRLLSARQVIIEGVIGEAKTSHGLSRCRYRGLVKFQLQLLLTASVVNLKRLLKQSFNSSIYLNTLVCRNVQLIENDLSLFN